MDRQALNEHKMHAAVVAAQRAKADRLAAQRSRELDVSSLARVVGTAAPESVASQVESVTAGEGPVPGGAVSNEKHEHSAPNTAGAAPAGGTAMASASSEAATANLKEEAEQPSAEYERDIRQAQHIEQLRQAAEELHIAQERAASAAAERAAMSQRTAASASATAPSIDSPKAVSAASQITSQEQGAWTASDVYEKDVEHAKTVEQQRQAALAGLIHQKREESRAKERLAAKERLQEEEAPSAKTGSVSSPAPSSAAAAAVVSKTLQEAAVEMAAAEEVAGDAEYQHDIALAAASSAKRTAADALAAAAARALSAARDARRQARADIEARQARQIAEAVFTGTVNNAQAPGNLGASVGSVALIPADYSDITPKQYEAAEAAAEEKARTDVARNRAARLHFLKERRGALNADAAAGRILTGARSAEAAMIVGSTK